VIVTKAHLDYWRAKHVPVWASKIEVKSIRARFAFYAQAGPSIHELINLQVRKPRGYPQDPKARKPRDPNSLHNTISLLQLVRHNIKTGAEKRTLREYLMYLRVTGHQGGRDKWAIRWIARIEHAETSR
jgi:hypothetical protein